MRVWKHKIVALTFLATPACYAQTLEFNEIKPQIGSVVIGETHKPKVISVSNVSGAPIFITQIAATNDYAESSHCPIWLAENSGCLIFVTFIPTAEGMRTGELRVRWVGGEESIIMTGFGALSTNRVGNATDRTRNDEETARDLNNDKSFTFQGLLSKNPADVTNFERVFELTRDSERKQRIASLLLSLGIRDEKYSQYLMSEAKKALTHDQDMPWPILYGQDGWARSLNPALNEWCRTHLLSFEDAETVAKYEIPVAWFYLSAAGDTNAYELLLKGLRSPNVMVSTYAARGLAVLQESRAIDEMISVGRNTQNEARFEIAKSLLYFPDPRAQMAAEELTPEKMRAGLELTRRAIKTNGVKALMPW